MSPGAAPVPVGHEVFAQLMGTFPTGVTVVTATTLDGVPRGSTVNAFCSVSASPPLCLVCFAKTSNTVPAVLGSGRFVVNFLCQDQEAVSREFASKAIDKFSNVAWRPSRSGQPILEGTAGFAECTLYRCIDAGDHWLMLGLVVDGTADTDASPMAYFRRNYGTFTPTPSRPTV